MTAPYVWPNRQQRRVLAAYVATGSLAEAAPLCGISYGTACSYMARMRKRTGLTTMQAVHYGTRDGWLDMEGVRG